MSFHHPLAQGKRDSMLSQWVFKIHFHHYNNLSHFQPYLHHDPVHFHNLMQYKCENCFRKFENANASLIFLASVWKHLYHLMPPSLTEFYHLHLALGNATWSKKGAFNGWNRSPPLYYRPFVRHQCHRDVTRCPQIAAIIAAASNTWGFFSADQHA